MHPSPSLPASFRPASTLAAVRFTLPTASSATVPSSFGTEFRLKVLYFLNRDISVSMDNRDFQRTHVDSKIEYAGPVQ